MVIDQKSFIAWVEKQNAQYSKLSDYFDEEQITTLYTLYADCLNLSNYNLSQVIENLGATIAGLVQFAAVADTLPTGAEKKAFVMETVENLYQLIDKGISGTEDNIDKDSGFALYGLSTEADFQEMILKMADTGIESLWNG